MLYDNLARKLKWLYRSPFEHSIGQNQAMWRKRSLHHLPALPPPPPHLVSIGWVRRNWSGVHLHDMPSTWSQSSRSPPSTTTVAHHRPHLLHLDKLGIHNLTIPRSKTTLIKSHSALSLLVYPFSENDWPVLPLWVCWSAALRFCCSSEWRKCTRCRCCLCDQFYRFWGKTPLLTEDIEAIATQENNSTIVGNPRKKDLWM